MVVEIDENNHRDRDKKYENMREGRIKKWLNCEFMRCNPDRADFNIVILIAQITNHIMKIKIRDEISEDD